MSYNKKWIYVVMVGCFFAHVVDFILQVFKSKTGSASFLNSGEVALICFWTNIATLCLYYSYSN